MDQLSARQQQILDFISAFIDERGYPPTIRDIQRGCDISSTSVVDYNLNALRSKGYLRRHSDVSRGIKLVGRERSRPADQTVSVPLLGTIAAGSPIALPEADAATALDAEDYFDLPQSLVGSGEALYALMVKGQSMIDALIDDGDVVVMRQANQVTNGQMAAVRIRPENETTLKRFYLEGSRVRLQPANSTMSPIYADAGDVDVLGRVVAVWRYLS